MHIHLDRQSGNQVIGLLVAEPPCTSGSQALGEPRGGDKKKGGERVISHIDSIAGQTWGGQGERAGTVKNL